MVELLTFACAGNLKGIKKALANKKLLLSLDDEKGWSPLHYASHYSKAKIVQVILDAGITPNIKSIPPQGKKQNDWNLALEEDKEIVINSIKNKWMLGVADFEKIPVNLK